MYWIPATFGMANSRTDMKKVVEDEKNGDVVLNFLNVSQLWKAGGHEMMSPILADQWRSRIRAQRRGGGGGCGVSDNEYSYAHGAQINFGDLTPSLTYGRKGWDRTMDPRELSE
jgi:hypothetical protein